MNVKTAIEQARREGAKLRRGEMERGRSAGLIGVVTLFALLSRLQTFLLRVFAVSLRVRCSISTAGFGMNSLSLTSACHASTPDTDESTVGRTRRAVVTGEEGLVESELMGNGVTICLGSRPAGRNGAIPLG